MQLALLTSAITHCANMHLGDASTRPKSELGTTGCTTEDTDPGCLYLAGLTRGFTLALTSESRQATAVAVSNH